MYLEPASGARDVSEVHPRGGNHRNGTGKLTDRRRRTVLRNDPSHATRLLDGHRLDDGHSDHLGLEPEREADARHDIEGNNGHAGSELAKELGKALAQVTLVQLAGPIAKPRHDDGEHLPTCELCEAFDEPGKSLFGRTPTGCLGRPVEDKDPHPVVPAIEGRGRREDDEARRRVETPPYPHGPAS